MLVLPSDPQEARFALSDFAESDRPPLVILQELACVLATGPESVTHSAGILLRKMVSPVDVPEEGIKAASPEALETVLAVLRPHSHRFIWPMPSGTPSDEVHRACEVILVRAACGDGVADQLCAIALSTEFSTAQFALYQLKQFFPSEIAIPLLTQVFISTEVSEVIRMLAGSHLARLGDRTPIPYFEDDLRKTISKRSRLQKALGLASVASEYGTKTAIEIIDGLHDAGDCTEGLKTVELVLSRFPNAPSSFHEIVQRLRRKLIDCD